MVVWGTRNELSVYCGCSATKAAAHNSSQNAPRARPPLSWGVRNPLTVELWLAVVSQVTLAFCPFFVPLLPNQPVDLRQAGFPALEACLPRNYCPSSSGPMSISACHCQQTNPFVSNDPPTMVEHPCLVAPPSPSGSVLPVVHNTALLGLGWAGLGWLCGMTLQPSFPASTSEKK